MNRKAVVSGRILTIFPQNFANWRSEFGKIVHRKLWALIIRVKSRVWK